MHVGNEEQQRRERLPALRDANLRGLLDGVRCIAACIRQADDLRLRVLRLQKEGREVWRIQWMADGAEHLAASLCHRVCRIALERGAKGIIGGEKVPAVAA